MQTAVELLGSRPYDEVSIEEIAEAAGVSKGLIYHYFPGKRELILAALKRGEVEQSSLIAVDADLEPIERLNEGLDRFLAFAEEHAAAYAAIIRTRCGSDPEIGAFIEAGRQRQIDSIVDGVAQALEMPPEPERAELLKTAVQGWFFFSEGAVLRWLEKREMSREQMRELLSRMLVVCLQEAGEIELPGPRPSPVDYEVNSGINPLLNTGSM